MMTNKENNLLVGLINKYGFKDVGKKLIQLKNNINKEVQNYTMNGFTIKVGDYFRKSDLSTNIITKIIINALDDNGTPLGDIVVFDTIRDSFNLDKDNWDILPLIDVIKVYRVFSNDDLCLDNCNYSDIPTLIKEYIVKEKMGMTSPGDLKSLRIKFPKFFKTELVIWQK